jgi:hypothetical protein
MSSVRHPRGRLPRRVYWVRRSIVLAIGLLLVFGINRLVGGTGADSPSSSLQASNSSAQQQDPTPSVSMGPVAPSKTLRFKAQIPLAPPSGDCLDDDVSVLPSVPHAWAGGDIVIRLALQGTQPACTFDVSPKSLVVKIVSGNDRIWSSQDCPKAIPTTQVVVRSAQPVQVPVTWSGRRSDEQCSSGPDWARLGFYHVYAAALGSTPTDVQFEVVHAPTVHKTRTPKPKPSATPSPSAKSTPRAKSSPSTTVSGKQSKCGGDNAAGSC